MKIKPKCDMLIDQNRYIDNDPVGHHCYNDANFKMRNYFVCKNCKQMLLNEPERITFGIGTVINWKKNISNYVKHILGK